MQAGIELKEQKLLTNVLLFVLVFFSFEKCLEYDFNLIFHIFAGVKHSPSSMSTVVPSVV